MQENPAVYYRVWGSDNVAYGPVELPTLVAWIRAERVIPETWVFSESEGRWVLAGEMTELKALFKSRGGRVRRR